MGIPEAYRDGVSDDSGAWRRWLASNPGVVHLDPGATYLLEDIEIPANTWIIGHPTARVIHKPQTQRSWKPLFRVTGPGVRFLDVRVDGNRAHHSSDGWSDAWNPTGGGRGARAAILADGNRRDVRGLQVRDCKFTSVYGACVAASEVNGLRVIWCEAADCSLELVYVRYGSGVDVQHNRMDRIGTGSPTVNGGAFIFGGVVGLNVSHNTAELIERKLAKIGGCSDVYVGHNYLRGNARTMAGEEMNAWPMLALHSDCHRVTLEHNTGRDIGSGLQIHSVAGLPNSDLTVTHNRWLGVRSHLNGAPDGIVMASGDPSDNILLGWNTITGARRAIQCNAEHTRLKVIENEASWTAQAAAVMGDAYAPLVERDNSWQRAA